MTSRNIPPPPSRTLLVGREHESRLLAELFDGGAAPSRAAVVLGEPGIGKSALLDFAVRAARERGVRVLTATGVEAEAQLPFAGLHQLLRTVLPQADALPAERREALLSALGMFDSPVPDHHLVALAAEELLADLAAEGPVAVVIDDVQWLDPQSHETLAFLARRASSGKAAIIGALRTGHPGPLLVAGLPEILIQGLTESASDRLLREHTVDLSSVDRNTIIAQALGNPLALLELPACHRADVARPEGVPALSARLESAFADRLHDLSATARTAILVAALDSSDDLTEVLLATGELAGAPVGAEAFAPAVEAGLVRLTDERVGFRHPLVRSAVAQAASVTERQKAHAALARVLAHEPYRSARHRARSIIGPDDAAADALEANVGIALGRGAVLEAIDDLERAAGLTGDPARRGHRLLIAAEHAYRLGRADLVGQLIRAAAATDLTDLDQARLAWLREILDGTPGDAPRVFELCEAAGAAIAGEDPDLALNLLLGAALRCWWADTGPEARTRVIEVTTALPDAHAGPRYAAVLAVAEPVLQGANVTRLLAATDLAEIVDAEALHLYGMAAHAVGDTPLAADLLDRAETRLRREGRLGLLAQVLSMQVGIRLTLGDLSGAEAAAQEGRQLGQDTGQPIWSAGTLVLSAIAEGLQGDPEHALVLAEQVEMAVHHRRLNDLLACTQEARGIAWLACGEPEAAFRALARMYDPDDPSYHQRELFAGIIFYAEAAVETGRFTEARRVLEQLERTARITPAPILHIHLLYARAVLGSEEELYLRALDHDLSRWPWARAQLEAAYGRWLLRAGRAEDAAARLRTAETALAEIGVASWAARIAAKLDEAIRGNAEW